jgi:predicted RNA-binding protein with PUA-like domain
MKRGDTVLFYHSVVNPSVVGIAQVSHEAYPDPTAQEGDWSCVDLVPLKAFPSPVSLAAIKATPSLGEIGLIRQSRLSVMPITAEEYQHIVKLGS